MPTPTFKKGKPKTGGRKKGTPNKTTVKVKQAIIQAFDKAGGVDYLVRVAQDDPRTFCTLLGRVLPTEMKHEVEHVNIPETTEEIMAEVNKLRREMEQLDTLH